MSTVLMGVLWLTFSNCCSFNHFYYLWLKFCFHFSSDQLGTCPCLCVCVCVHILKDYVIVCDFSDPWLLGLTSSCSEWRSECSPSRGRAGCELAPADRFHESPVSSCPSHPLAQPLHEHTSLMPPSTVSSAFHKKSLLHIRVWVFFFFCTFSVCMFKFQMRRCTSSMSSIQHVEKIWSACAHFQSIWSHILCACAWDAQTEHTRFINLLESK